jgi:glycerol-3-phosphate dehydrogenase
MTRERFISKAKSEFFDVCIIGGGITGAGVLTQAVRRGWKAALIDSQDFAYGTSSRSSKIIHGGLRYLKLLQFGLVRRTLLDREHLLLSQPRLVKPIPFIKPSYSSFEMMANSMIVGLYEKLAGKSSLKKFERLTPDEVLHRIPGIRTDGLKGGILYWEGWTNDALLTIHYIRDAVDKKAVVLNYCEAMKFSRTADQVESVLCFDKLTGEELAIRAKVFVNATGVWVDSMLKLVTGKVHSTMRPSKGVHIVVSNKKIPSDFATIVTSGTSDKRLLYCFPWEHGLTALGATDTEYNGSRDKINVTEEDVDYLLNAFNIGFPSARLRRGDIVSVYAGLRPILDDKRNNGSYSRSREFRIWWSADNFINIGGGKLTSFLSMGERCMQVVESKIECETRDARYELKNVPEGNKLSCKDTLIGKIVEEDPALIAPIIDGLTVTGADIIYHVRYSFAQTLADVFTRRTALTYAMKGFNEKAVRRVADIMAGELKRNDDWKERQAREFYEHWKEYHPELLYN